MSVLGPLSIDPNMLNTQKQQVQVGGRDCKWNQRQLPAGTYNKYKWTHTHTHTHQTKPQNNENIDSQLCS